MPARTPHTAWCARDHKCALGEHRADPIVVDLSQLGRGVLTRLEGTDGREYAEIRVRIPLPRHEGKARLRLAALLSRLPILIEGAG